MDALYQFGINLIHAIQGVLSPALDGFMSAVSFMGRIEFFLVLIPFIYWTIDQRIGIRVLLLLAYEDFTVHSFKLFLRQPRPYWLGGVKQLSLEPTYGLPSSHAGSSISVGGYLAVQVKKKWFWIVTGILVFLVGFSRLHLGVHFPHDVLVGWLIGIVVLWGFTKLEDKAHDWLKDKTLASQIGFGFANSIVIVLIGLLIRFLISGTTDPVSWSSFSVDSRSVTHFFTLAGVIFGAYTGYALKCRYARFSAQGEWNMRVIRYFAGIISLLLFFYGLDKLFALIAPDESTMGYALRFIRYGFAALWVTFIAPWLFLKFKLAEPED